MEMLFLIVVKSLVGLSQLLAQSLLQIKQRLYCCLLFFFNFFQYVKELFYPGSLPFPGPLPISVPFVTGTGDGGE